MSKSLRVLLDVSRPANHLLKVIVRLTQIVHRRRKEDTSPKSIAKQFGLQSERDKLIVASPVKHLRGYPEKNREKTRGLVATAFGVEINSCRNYTASVRLLSSRNP